MKTEVNEVKTTTKATKTKTKQSKSEREIAKELGVSNISVHNVRKSMGLKGDTMTPEQEQEVVDNLSSNVAIRKRNEETIKTLEENSVSHEIEVRRIDLSNDSSIVAMLQDCKERYVKNEIIIEKLQHEIDQQSVLVLSNANCTLSSFPQLNSIEKFQKLNIALRNQIVQLESELGRIVNVEENNDPFE